MEASRDHCSITQSESGFRTGPEGFARLTSQVAAGDLRKWNIVGCGPLPQAVVRY
jgi:hypothetical protein